MSAVRAPPGTAKALMSKLSWSAALVACASVCASAPYGRETVRVPAGGDLQAALDAAQPGDVIVLPAGAEYVGNFVLPRKEGNAWITVRSEATRHGVPPDSRIGPQHARSLASIRSPNSQPALRAAPRAHHWRLELLEFRPSPSVGATLVEFGTSAQSTLDVVPRDLVVDRCYFHGDPSRGQKRGLALNSAATTIVNSYFADFKHKDEEAQAIAGWNGPGPFVLENNHLEASGISFLLGGADPSIPGLIPSDVTFRRNLVSRPEAWREARWAVKNLLELKNARRVLIEANIFENNWAHAQVGYAILFTVANSGGRAFWANVEDVTFRHNVVRHAGGGISVLGRDQTGDPSGVARGIRISGNLFYDIDKDRWGGAGIFMQILHGPEDLIVEHNTVIHNGAVISAGGPKEATGRRFIFRDNLMRHNQYGVHGTGRSIGSDSLDAYFPGAQFSRNVLAGGRASLYPRDNLFPTEEEFERSFVDFAHEDYRLRTDASLSRAAVDGGPVGAPPEVFQLLQPTRRH
jgi:Right handed beta helix region